MDEKLQIAIKALEQIVETFIDPSNNDTVALFEIDTIARKALEKIR